jgi:imidazolonepropionase-like amidohydrolase
MRRFRLFVWICALPVVFGATRDTAPDEPPLALVGGTIYPSPDSPPIKDGTIVAANGKILSVGARGDIVVPRNSTRLDC